MENAVNKIQSVFEWFYQIIILSVLFLVTNIFFFQIFFSIDFTVVFLPIYFIVSITIIPSSIGLIRVIHRLKNGESNIWKIYWEELKVVVRSELKYIILIMLCIFLTLLSLYISDYYSNIPVVFYILNLSMLGFEILYCIEVIGNSLNDRGKECFINALRFIGKNIFRQILIVLCIFLLVAIIKFYFSLIIIIFGVLFKIYYVVYKNSLIK